MSEVKVMGGLGPLLVKLVNDELAVILLGALAWARKSVIKLCLVSFGALLGPGEEASRRKWLVAQSLAPPLMALCALS